MFSLMWWEIEMNDDVLKYLKQRSYSLKPLLHLRERNVQLQKVMFMMQWVTKNVLFYVLVGLYWLTFSTVYVNDANYKSLPESIILLHKLQEISWYIILDTYTIFKTLVRFL